MLHHAMKAIDVLGTPLAVTTYSDLAEYCREKARNGRCRAVDFTNTHIVTLRRHERAFRELTDHFDVFVPDGMPLIWCMNQRGANLRDRVYGPTFMRRLLENPPQGSTHYLIGGTEECGQQLRRRFPAAHFVGSFHGQCNNEGILEGAAEELVIADLKRLAPDFIWVGLGTPKQYAWSHRNRPAMSRGVILAVGFAFDVNAGTKPDAPQWMQRLGLTWLFRLLSEPRRLGWRYLRYNSLFLFYVAADALERKR
jgi:N-acetylglucosaminyldiphosphoundecaprenol N-acetyl-beta-D-mannosaminyltransferase